MRDVDRPSRYANYRDRIVTQARPQIIINSQLVKIDLTITWDLDRGFILLSR